MTLLLCGERKILNIKINNKKKIYHKEYYKWNKRQIKEKKMDSIDTATERLVQNSSGKYNLYFILVVVHFTLAAQAL